MTDTLSVEIAKFTQNEGNWLKLDDMFEVVFSSADPAYYYTAIFALFERFPESDGAGVFWSALHGMEAAGNYEQDLLKSFQKQPSEMTKTMLYRMRNAGDTKVAGVPISDLID